MKIGLVGFPSAGKTTVFNALTGLAAETGYRAARGRTNLGVVKVPDPRVDALARLFKPKKVTYAEITFADVAADPLGGQVRGLDAKTLAAMREVDALCHVLRAFPGPSGEAADPLRDAVSLDGEMNLADLILVENRLERLARERGPRVEKELLEKLAAHLDSGTPLRLVSGLNPADWAALSGYRFLTQKPLMLVLNVTEEDAARPAPGSLEQHASEAGLGLVTLAGSVEMDIAHLPTEEQHEFASSLGLAEPALGRFIRKAYDLIDLISFLTAGPDECRAWPIRRGTTALKAAGKIHSDIERGFIRAEVIDLDDLLRLGSEARCREAGRLRLEGKTYVVADGDVVNFRFNV
jgi:hypothetical protein